MRGLLALLAVLAICIAPVLGSEVDSTGYVAVEPIAQSLGWTFERTPEGARVDDGRGAKLLRVGSRAVREDDNDVVLFDQPLTERNGQLTLALADAESLFHTQLSAGGNVAQTAGADDVEIREIPRPATPSPPPPTPTPRPVPDGHPAVQGQAGTLAFSVAFDGHSELFQSAATINGSGVRGALSAQGTDTFGAPLGVVTLGTVRRNTSFGSLNDPLSGVVHTNGGFSGVDLHSAAGNGAFDVYSGRRFDGSDLFALQHTSGGTSDVLGFLTEGGHLNDVLERHQIATSATWGTFREETLASLHGTGVGLDARTRGATFVDATLSREFGTLPLIEGDLPSSLSVGHQFGHATTFSAGYAESQGIAPTAFLGASTRSRNVSLALTAAAHTQTAVLSATGNGSFMQFYAVTGVSPTFAINGGLTLSALQVDVNGTHSSGTTGGTFQARTTHGGLNLAAGVDVESSVIHPLLGVVAALAPAFSLETALIRGSSGRPAIRLSIVAGFRNRAPHERTFPLTVAVDGIPNGAAARVLVDGAPAGALRNARANVALTAGSHDVYAETADGTFSSPEREVVGGADHTVALALLKQRMIRGHVRFAAAPGQIPAGVNLQGVRVLLSPGDASVVCDADGRFAFPRAPYDPRASLRLDPETLPRGFVVPAPVTIDGADELDIPLVPAQGVERQIFR